ncbi:2-C-methyl-D-erythritol 4-phosphate cytidylyltransferase [Leptospira sp. 2 VSF19]|uniref:2-C-methyl-D-erythritol 4-phosphate cytidylyltransferase n=1 Tax=Leptospira soteropolitanensis TaxID=2950025 RepID=A0AAW5VEN4_9LEPT|nr:IspD/TarI family cytidylyltransferase [Leptospira soteropolitanensis]MCW7492824.1 2-C-methyl-D-erythritol 4-phosphate cytidylyltransferase [Leptospira soteropolitanensis]MCW7500059.1 2-C-methyl-D-erythritol 4-phosphate cytidylyltransferase [Leptospira soteropolitanensis]MCW7522310.1 2-C-methyl-D-erythritol 4-phosphate cytidylyltransferase [Leptospira soteropolitanensis]MCW7526166.1 2-C-methyl-D-erythritol 4-phosphate cytidylyltransferase [Leptospira soteropolitanensis]MCW7529722.1 2-C-methy
MNNLYVVLLAGGTGTRMGMDIPKQFLKIRGESLLRHSVKRFRKFGLIKSITVVSHPDWILETEKELDDLLEGNDRIVPGGESRHLSTLCGISSIPYDTKDIFFIHDVARPNFKQNELYQLVEQTKIFGAASLVAKSTESLVRVRIHTNYTDEPLKRDEVYSVKTPQSIAGFMIQELLAEGLDSDIKKHPTDLCTWMDKKRVGIVETDYHNVKVTSPGDVTLAESLFWEDLPSVE